MEVSVGVAGEGVVHVVGRAPLDQTEHLEDG